MVRVVYPCCAHRTACVRHSGRIAATQRRGSAGDELIVTRMPGYLLRVQPEQFDVQVFGASVERARQDLGRDLPSDAVTRYDQALALTVTRSASWPSRP
jgi:hypothetical protein